MDQMGTHRRFKSPLSSGIPREETGQTVPPKRTERHTERPEQRRQTH